ncbi:MAG: hypothetical protein KDA69_16255, partial [Planctomycetaceae bacterium]|nr:hypothetical protein [Planctomycetaceae bacterium]
YVSPWFFIPVALAVEMGTWSGDRPAASYGFAAQISSGPPANADGSVTPVIHPASHHAGAGSFSLCPVEVELHTS